MILTDWIAMLAVFGALDSMYTAFQQKYSNLFQFCFDKNGRTDCKEILHSKYSRIFLVPNSWIGVVAYTLIAIIFSSTDYYVLGAILAKLGLAFSIYLLFVQIVKLKKYCIFCLISTALMLVIAILASIAASSIFP